MVRIGLLALILLLSGCANAAAHPIGANAQAFPSPVDPCQRSDLAGQQSCAWTRQAQYQQAQNAYSQQVTNATATAAGMATATAASMQATAQAISATRTEIESQQQAAAAIANATSTASAASLSATGTAIAMVFQGTATADAMQATREARIAHATATARADQMLAEYHQGLLQAELVRANLENDEYAQSVRIKSFLPVGLTLIGVLIVVGQVVIFRLRRKPIVIVENGIESVLIPEGTFMRANPPALSRPQPLLEAPKDEPIPERGGRVDLPTRLPTGRLGVGAALRGTGYGQGLWLEPDDIGLLGAGATGSGKSNLARSLAYQAYKQDWPLFLADAELTTFTRDIWGDVAKSVGDTEAMIGLLLLEIDRRLSLYSEAQSAVRELPIEQQFYVDNLASYNRASELFDDFSPLKPMLFVADEANNLLGQSNSLDEAFHELLRRNRKAGAGVALFGHTWHASQIPTPIRANLKMNVVFRVNERISKVILGRGDAARIPPEAKGRVLIEGGPVARPTMVQTYYLPAARVLQDVRPIHHQTVPPPIINGNGHYEESEEDIEAAMNGLALIASELRQLNSLNAVAKHLAGKETNANAEEYEAAARALWWRVQNLHCDVSRQILDASRSSIVQEVMGA